MGLHNNNCPGWSGGREVNQDPRKGSLGAVPEQAQRRVEISPGCHHQRTGAVGCGELSLILNNVLKSRTLNVTFSLFDCVHGIKIWKVVLPINLLTCLGGGGGGTRKLLKRKMERMLRGNPNETIISSQIPFAHLLDQDVQRLFSQRFFFFFTWSRRVLVLTWSR